MLARSRHRPTAPAIGVRFHGDHLAAVRFQFIPLEGVDETPVEHLPQGDLRSSCFLSSGSVSGWGLAALGWHWAQATPLPSRFPLTHSSRPLFTTLMNSVSHLSGSASVNSSAPTRVAILRRPGSEFRRTFQAAFVLATFSPAIGIRRIHLRSMFTGLLESLGPLLETLCSTPHVRRRPRSWLGPSQLPRPRPASASPSIAGTQGSDPSSFPPPRVGPCSSGSCPVSEGDAIFRRKSVMMRFHSDAVRRFFLPRATSIEGCLSIEEPCSFPRSTRILGLWVDSCQAALTAERANANTVRTSINAVLCRVRWRRHLIAGLGLSHAEGHASHRTRLTLCVALIASPCSTRK